MTPRRQGDYANDPLIAYSVWHSHVPGAWREWAKASAWPTAESRWLTGGWLAGVLSYPTWPGGQDDQPRIEFTARWLSAMSRVYTPLAADDVEESDALKYKSHLPDPALQPVWEELFGGSSDFALKLLSAMGKVSKSYGVPWVENAVAWWKAAAKVPMPDGKSLLETANPKTLLVCGLWESPPPGWFTTVVDLPSFNGQAFGYIIPLAFFPPTDVNFEMFKDPNVQQALGWDVPSALPTTDPPVPVPMYWAQTLPAEWKGLQAFGSTRWMTGVLKEWGAWPGPYPFDQTWWNGYRQVPWAARLSPPARPAWDAAFGVTTYSVNSLPYRTKLIQDDQPELEIPAAEYPIGRMEVRGKKK